MTKNKLVKSEFAKELEINDTKVTNYTTGRSTPRIETIINIVNKFNVSADELLLKDISKIENESYGILKSNLKKEYLVISDTPRNTDLEEESASYKHDIYKLKYEELSELHIELQRDHIVLQSKVTLLYEKKEILGTEKIIKPGKILKPTF